ncbi:MAG: hypothetical protein C0403_03265 [Desulfobacterium sp.]|nr:hypothetical protein [Desulfobacterium sp.]
MSHSTTSFPIKALFLVTLFALTIQLSCSYADQIQKPEVNNHRVFFAKEPIFNSQIYVSESGMQHDRTVVLIHGVSEKASDDWKNVVDIVDDSFHVITFDLPGFGRSEKKDLIYSIEKYSSFLNWFIGTYTKKPISIVGHSLGGAISLYYAGTYPKGLDRLIIVDVPGILHRSAYFNSFVRLSPSAKNNSSNSPLNFLENVAGTSIKNVDSILMPDNFKEFLNSDIIQNKTKEKDARTVAGISLLDTDYSEIIANISTPTNIIWGENDSIAPIRTGRLLSGSIPISTLSIIPNGSHSPMFTEPAEFNKILLSCLNGSTSIAIKDAPGDRQIEKQIVLNDEKDILLNGTYGKILIKNCERIKLLNATVEQMIIENSEVTIENSVIHSYTYALNAIDSIITITGSSIKGENAIIVNNCELDIAGGKIQGINSAIQSLYNTRILFSVCKVKSMLTDRYFHEILNVYINEPI